MPIKTPVAFLVFNRPDVTERVFAEIAKARPSRLLVVADGPRPGKEGEAERCAAVRAIIDRVDWDCEVLKNYSEFNLGCRKRVSTGLDWVFENCEEAIVLEDDCLPSQSFFPFCQELLERYRDDSRVMQVCGTNVFQQWGRNNADYFFSKYGPIWGWASWRRAWKTYDVDMKLWPQVKERGLYKDFCTTEEEEAYRLKLYDDVYSGKIDTWDYQWGFAKMINSGLSAIPVKNLISNIGFGENATHTHDALNPAANMKTNELAIQLMHPHFILRDSMADIKYVRDFMGLNAGKNSSFLNRFLKQKR